MKIRFEVDQAEAFRQGIDCPKSIVTIEVNPAEVDPEERALLADFLQGIDVCRRFFYDGEVIKGHHIKELLSAHVEPQRIVASAPTFKALMVAVRKEAKVIEAIQARFKHPVQLRILTQPPVDQGEYHPIKWENNDFAEDVRPWLDQGFRVKFQCFINDVQTKLNELLNAKSYRVSILPVPDKPAQGLFYCDRVFSAKFGDKQLVAHSPTIIYNEKTGRIVNASNLMQAVDIYLLDGSNPAKGNINDMSILRWQGENWVIISPEGLIDLANRASQKA